MAPGIQPLLGSLLAVQLGGDGWKCQRTKVCADVVGPAWEEGQEEQAALAGCIEETLGEAGTWLDVGGCGAEVPFESVFHEDMSDKPDWKGECLQRGPGRRPWPWACSQDGKGTEGMGRLQLALPPLEPLRSWHGSAQLYCPPADSSLQHKH